MIPPCFSFPICTGASSIRRILNPKRTANSWSLWFRIQFWFWAFALHVRHGKYLLFFFFFSFEKDRQTLSNPTSTHNFIFFRFPFSFSSSFVYHISSCLHFLCNLQVWKGMGSCNSSRISQANQLLLLESREKITELLLITSPGLFKKKFKNRSKLFLFAVWELARFWYKPTLRSPAWVHILSGRFTQSSSCSYFSL